MSVAVATGQLRIGLEKQVSPVDVSSVSEVSPGILKRSNFDFPFLLAVQSVDGTYSYARIENGEVSDNKLLSDVELTYQNGDSGLVTEENGVVKVFITKTGINETALIIERGVTGITLPDASVLPVKIIFGKIVRGRLMGDFEMLTLTNNVRILGSFDTRGKLTRINTINSLKEPNATTTLISKELLRLAIILDGKTDNRVLGVNSDQLAAGNPSTVPVAGGTVASFFQVRQDPATGSLAVVSQAGAQGVAGPQGPEGPTGPIGAAGPSNGPKGDKGDKGDTGLQGIQGIQGLTGLDGLDGTNGIDGINGLAGADGYTPIFGVDYFNGADGATGPKGDKGDTGLQGIQGIQGPAGIASLTAIGSVPNANGATLTGDVLNLQPANGSFGGVVTTILQTIAGAKTFSSILTASNGLTMTTGALSLTSTSGVINSTGLTGLTQTLSSGTAAITAPTLNLNTSSTGNTTIGNGTGTFALTSSGGLNVTTGGALTGVASIDTIGTTATALTFAGTGTLSSTTTSAITLDSGTTGAVNVGTGANAKTVSVGNTTGASRVNINSGTGGIFANGLGAAQGSNTFSVCFDTTNNKLLMGSARNNCQTSSIRFKHNVQDIIPGLGLDAVNILRPVSYEYNDGNAKNLGFIAEEAALVDERLINRDAQGLPYSLNTDTFIPILTKGIQQLDLKVNGMGLTITDTAKKLSGMENVAGISTETATAITTNGELLTNSILATVMGMINDIYKNTAEFFGSVIFRGDVSFSGRPTFNKDTAGFAIIKSGATEVEVKFEKEYANEPVVTISMNIAGDVNIDDMPSYVVADVNTKGFKIRASKILGMDIRYSWTAIAVSEAKTVEGDSSTTVGMTAVTPAATPPTPTATPTPSIDASPSATPTSTATPTHIASQSAAARQLDGQGTLDVSVTPTPAIEITSTVLPTPEASGGGVLE
jgi:hypothetical protein